MKPFFPISSSPPQKRTLSNFKSPSSVALLAPHNPISSHLTQSPLFQCRHFHFKFCMAQVGGIKPHYILLVCYPFIFQSMVLKQTMNANDFFIVMDLLPWLWENSLKPGTAMEYPKYNPNFLCMVKKIRSAKCVLQYWVRLKKVSLLINFLSIFPSHSLVPIKKVPYCPHLPH